MLHRVRLQDRQTAAASEDQQGGHHGHVGEAPTSQDAAQGVHAAGRHPGQAKKWEEAGEASQPSQSQRRRE